MQAARGSKQSRPKKQKDKDKYNKLDRRPSSKSLDAFDDSLQDGSDGHFDNRTQGSAFSTNGRRDENTKFVPVSLKSDRFAKVCMYACVSVLMFAYRLSSLAMLPAS